MLRGWAVARQMLRLVLNPLMAMQNRGIRTRDLDPGASRGRSVHVRHLSPAYLERKVASKSFTAADRIQARSHKFG